MVIRCDGSEVATTRPGKVDCFGGIQWVETIQFFMHGENENIDAIVLSSRRSSGDSWCFVPGCLFETFNVKFGHSTWAPPSTSPGSGPTFCAELETFLEGDDSRGSVTHLETVLNGGKSPEAAKHSEARVDAEKRQGDTRQAPTSGHYKQKAVNPFLDAEGGAGTGESRPVSVSPQDSEAVWLARSGAETHGMARPREGSYPVPKQLNASVSGSTLSGASCDPVKGSFGYSALRLPEAHFFTYLVKGESFQPRHQTTSACDTTCDDCGASGWKGLADDGLETEKEPKETLRRKEWHDTDGRRVRWCWIQPPSESGGITISAVPYPSTGVGERNVGPRPHPVGYVSHAADPRPAEHTLHAVKWSSTVPQSTASPHEPAPLASRSGEEEGNVTGDATRASGAGGYFPPELAYTPRTWCFPSFRALHGVDVELKSRPVHHVKNLLSTRGSTTRENLATCVPAFAPISSEHNSFRTERLMPRNKPCPPSGDNSLRRERLMPRSEPHPTEIRRPHDSGSHVMPIARAPSHRAVAPIPPFQTRTVQLPETLSNTGGNRIYFTCVSPRSVSAGCEFQLRVAASFLQIPDDPSLEESRGRGKEGVIQAGVPGSLTVEQSKRVTAELVSGDGVGHKQKHASHIMMDCQSKERFCYLIHFMVEGANLRSRGCRSTGLFNCAAALHNVCRFFAGAIVDL